MRKKSQPWLVPLLILIAVLWAMGKKDTPPSPAKPNPPPPANTLVCSGLMKPDTLLGENARQIEVSDDQTTPYLFR